MYKTGPSYRRKTEAEKGEAICLGPHQFQSRGESRSVPILIHLRHSLIHTCGRKCGPSRLSWWAKSRVYWGPQGQKAGTWVPEVEWPPWPGANCCDGHAGGGQGLSPGLQQEFAASQAAASTWGHARHQSAAASSLPSLSSGRHSRFSVSPSWVPRRSRRAMNTYSRWMIDLSVAPLTCSQRWSEPRNALRRNLEFRSRKTEREQPPKRSPHGSSHPYPPISNL